MKIKTIVGATILLVFMACAVYLQADSAAPGSSGNVSLEAQDMPFDAAMGEIAKQAGVQIICDNNLKNPISGHFGSMELEELIGILTKMNKLTWQKLYLPVPDKDNPVSVDQIKHQIQAVSTMSGGTLVICDSAGNQKVFVEQQSTNPTVDPAKLGLKLVYVVLKPTVETKNDAATKLKELEGERLKLLSQMSSKDRVDSLQSEMRYVMDLNQSDREQYMADQFSAMQGMMQDPRYRQTWQDTMQSLRSQGLIPQRGRGGGFGGTGGGGGG